ncbi:VCBS domain-containing protein, partial [Shewanella sp. 0m-7]
NGIVMVAGDLDAIDPDTGDTDNLTWSFTPQPSDYGTFSIDPDTGTWQYLLNESDADDSLVNQLAYGESRTEIYTVVVTDTNGLTDTQQVTITITGTNDIPELSATQSGTVTEDMIDVAPDRLVATGILTATDVDNNDVLSLDSSYNDDINWQNGANATLSAQQISDIIASFSLDNDDMGWTYDIDNDLLNFLAEGDVITLSFDVTVTDSNGAFDTETVTITINGSNDGPTANTDTHVVNEAINDGITAAIVGEVIAGMDHGGGFADVADSDPENQVLNVVKVENFDGDVIGNGDTAIGNNIVLVGEFGTLTISSDGSYSYQLDDSNPVINELDDGETETDSFSYWIEDADNQQAMAILTITINGAKTPDAPIVTIVDDNNPDEGILSLQEIGNDDVQLSTSIDHDELIDGGFVTLTITNDGVESTLTLTWNSNTDSLDISGTQNTQSGFAYDANTGVVTWTESAPDSTGDSITVTATQTDFAGNESAESTDTALIDLRDYEFIVGGPGDDAIDGDNQHQIVISDTTAVQPGENYNLAFIIDTSGSMGEPAVSTAADQLEIVFNLLLDSLNDPDNTDPGTVNVLLIEFDTGLQQSISVNLADPGAIDTLQDALDALSNGGWTNYQSAFNATSDWFESAPVVANAGSNITYFITDGRPTRPGNEANAYSVAVTAFNELNGLSFVQAIGLGANIDTDILDDFDSLGAPLNNVDVDDLADAILSTDLLPGSDTVNGSGGNDILFGDLVEFDSLPGLQAADAITQYVADQTGELLADVSVNDAHIYIRENYDEFDVSRADDLGDILNGQGGDDIIFGQGGTDTLRGGAGNDILLGGNGDDTLVGGTGRDLLSGGEGSDDLYGGSMATPDDGESDYFVWNADSADANNTIDNVYGFNTQFDVLVLSDILIGENYGNLEDYLSFDFTGPNTTIIVDANGSAPGSDGVSIILNGVELEAIYGSNSDTDVIAGLLNDSALLIDPNTTPFIPPYDQVDDGLNLP